MYFGVVRTEYCSANHAKVVHAGGSLSCYNTDFKWKLYELFRKHGIEHFQIVLIRNTPCNSKEELKKEERKDLEFYDKQLWLSQSTPSKKRDEWIIENKERIKIQKKVYHKLHKEERTLKEKNIMH